RGVGPSRVYHLKEPAVVAELLDAVKVKGIWNGMAVGLIPPSLITARRKDGSAETMSLLGETQVQFYGAVVDLGSEFVAALNRLLTKQQKGDVDITEFLPPANQT